MAILTPTRLIKLLGNELAFSHNVLEITTEYMLNIIRDKTLGTFSSFYPHIVRINLSADITRVPGSQNKYRIPREMINPNQIRQIINIYCDNLNSTYNTPFLGQNYFVNIFEEQMRVNTLSGILLNETFRFHPPNIIEIFPAYAYFKNFTVDVALTHHPNFFTIRPQHQQNFIELALIDIKKTIWTIRSIYPNLATAFGNIEMDLDNYSNADDKRQEWIERHTKYFTKSVLRKRIWVG
jgi:hypothetical protein